MTAGVTAVGICNRAMQRIGARRFVAFTDNLREAAESNACYDNLRRDELRRNVWRFSIRTSAIRALVPSARQLTFATWASGTTYAQYDIALGSDSQIYISSVGSNTGNDPTKTTGFWTLYFGPTQANQFIVNFSGTQVYAFGQYAIGSNGTVYSSLVNNNLGNDPTVVPAAWSNVTTYAAGNFVTGSDNNVYQSLVNTNLNHNPVGDGGVHWTQLQPSANGSIGWQAQSLTVPVSYFAGELVYTLGTTAVYFSTVSSNQTNPTTDTTGSWQVMTATPTLAPVSFNYPVGVGLDRFTYPIGPTTSFTSATRSVYMLPNGFLREAQQNPKAGDYSIMGLPSNRVGDDWLFNDQCFTSRDNGVIVLRFAADVSDPTKFDTMYAEGLALRIASELCETLTQSTEKLAAIERDYDRKMGAARLVNGIETGPSQPVLDDFLLVRY